MIVVGTFVYLRPAAPAHPSYAGPARIPELDSRFWPAFDFITPSLGWAAISEAGVSWAFVYRTTDGGAHWQKQFVQKVPYSGSPSIHFFDSKHGFLYTDRLFSSSDGGEHWSVISIPDATANFAFASPTSGWALDGQVVYGTKDGGLTWRTVGRAPALGYLGKGFGEFAFRAGGEGWIGGVGSTPFLYATLDGGANWRQIGLPVTATALPLPVPQGKPYVQGYTTAIRLLPGEGVLAQSFDWVGHVNLYVSVDHGDSWSQIVRPPDPATIADVSFVDATHWWASRFGFLYKSSDGGRTWQPQKMIVPEVVGDWNLGPLSTIDGRHAWLIMRTGAMRSSSALLMTSDGGRNWTLVNVPQPV